MATTDEITSAERELERAFAALSKSTTKNGAGTENRYGQAYQRLVLLGARPQLRAKYRGR